MKRISHRFHLWGILLVPIALNTQSGAGLCADKPSRPPNILLVFVDDMGYGDLGCYGSKIPTPNIDRLAREGIRFTDFYVSQPVCTASRAALLTGCYSNRVGLLGALGPAAQVGIHDNERTIAQVLKPCGYATAIFGKWHLGHHPQFLPTKHGFDEYFGLPYSNDMWPNHPTTKFPDLPLIDGNRIIEMNPDQTKLTTQYTEHAVKFIEKNKAQPFFLYVPHSMPHVPLHVSDKFRGKSPQGLYGDVIMELDWSVGQMLEALKKHDLERNTLVIFTSDNGPWLSYGNHGGSAGPLREGKGTSFEGGVREPFIARWPGRIPAGRVCREPAMTIDLLPTFSNLVGANAPGDRMIDGKDIWPLLSGRRNTKSPHDGFYFYWGGALEAVRSGKWKLHLPHNYQSLEQGGAEGKPGKYVPKRIELSLFDLEKDVGETTNVAAQHPEIVKQLMELVEKARDDLGDTLTMRKGKGVREPGRVAMK